jgi:Rrf2 family protein
MRMTAKSEYGLLAMIDLASCEGDVPVSAREVSERQAIPGKYLEQLLVALRKAGLVKALRGAHGGFVLARPASEITVLQIVEALEGPVAATVCDGDRATTCGRSAECAAFPVWSDVTAAVRGVLGKTTLGDLAIRQAKLS